MDHTEYFLSNPPCLSVPVSDADKLLGCSDLLCLKLYEKILREVTPDRAKAEAHMAAFDRAAWEEQIRRIFGRAAGEIIAIEDKTKKNSPESNL